MEAAHFGWKTQEPALPEQLAQFQATEVIGCNSNSLKPYLEEGNAFGVLPHQLVNQGYGSIPTALVMYQIDTRETHGLWKTAGRQNANGQQVRVCAPQSAPKEGKWQCRACPRADWPALQDWLARRQSCS